MGFNGNNFVLKVLRVAILCTKCNIDLLKEMGVIYYSFNKNMPYIYAVDINTGIFLIKNKHKNVYKDA